MNRSSGPLSPSFPLRLQPQRAGFCKMIQMMKTRAAITQIRILSWPGHFQPFTLFCLQPDRSRLSLTVMIHQQCSTWRLFSFVFSLRPDLNQPANGLGSPRVNSALHGNNGPQCCVACRGNAIGAAVGLLLDPALPQHSGNNLRACWMHLFWPKTPSPAHLL